MSLLSQSRHFSRPSLVVIGLLALMGFMLFPVTAASQEADLGPYSLNILGKAVTDDNKDDILGDGSGSVSFDPDTRTLTLTNATIQDEKIGTAISSKKDLIVRVVGENTIHVPGTKLPSGYEVDRVAITAKGLVFEGDGAVDISTAKGQVVKKSHAIVVGEGGVVINGPTVSARSGGLRYGGARGVLSAGTVIINNGALKAESKMSTQGCIAIESGDSVIINGGTVEAIGGHTAKEYPQDFPDPSIGIYAYNNIQINGGNVTTSGAGSAFYASQGNVAVDLGLSVLVSQKRDGLDAVEWDRRSLLKQNVKRTYKYIKISEGAAKPSDSSVAWGHTSS